MASLHNKRIIIGISGGIAAYKAAELVRLLMRDGAEVRVVMTEAAQAFITPLTLQALSGQPVRTSLLDANAEAGMGHIELARWADFILLAPASADLMARLALGLADDLLTTLCLATQAPIAVAPAMNQAMWRQPATQDNVHRLRDHGRLIWGPDSGEQACGDLGPGRMLEPSALQEKLTQQFAGGALAGRQVVITAGPTREPVDPVRYLSNHSSGKMGYALAQAALEAGARVCLISGPTALAPPVGVQVEAVTTAEEMLNASLTQAEHADIFIAAAAVADYRPASVAPQKLKKSAGETWQLDLVKNADIVATVAALPNRPFTVGFAAETQEMLANAEQKLRAKNLDLVFANDVSDPRRGFNSDDNAVTIVDGQSRKTMGPSPKIALARELIAEIARRIVEHRNA